jgi:hypothetical protein
MGGRPSRRAALPSMANRLAMACLWRVHRNTLGRMAEGEDSIQYFRRWARRQYLTKHEQERRARAKAEGARRIDVTLRGQMLEDFERVKQWIEGVNRVGIERGFYNRPRTMPDGTVDTIPPPRLSDTEIIKSALSLAASKIEDDERG